MPSESKLEASLIRHAEKISSKMKPEDVTEEQITEMRNKVLVANPHIRNIDDESLRHLVLFDSEAAVFGPEISGQREKSSITFEGIIRAQREAKYFADQIEKLPDNSVIIIGPGSPKDRCQETQWIYEQEIKARSRDAENQKNQIVIFEDKGLITQDTLDEKNIGKAVMINHESMEGIEAEKVGPWGPTYLDEMKKVFTDSTKDKETPAVKVWTARSRELDTLKDELVQQGSLTNDNKGKIDPSKFGSKENTPEEISREIITYLQQIFKTSREKYPDRPVYFQSISHNMILDVASLRLLGNKITRESLRELTPEDGNDYEASRPLEGRTVKFENGQLIVSFRGKEKAWTAEELEKLTEEEGILDQEAESRLKEWRP